ncbi:MAG: nucleoside-diphosphate sugar epimerase/dehydratase [Actinomycetota bacterium]|nr:nucleoside-diphosphate sugar epimerase/dehydratase [Actinomycetota bacterium]
MSALDTTLTDAASTPVEADPRSFDNLWRRLLMATSDILGWPLAFLFVALVEEQPLDDHQLALLMLVSVVSQLMFGTLTGLYRGRFRPFSFEEIGAASLSTGLSGFAVLIADRLANDDPFGHRCVWATASAASLILLTRYVRRWRARYVRTKRARSRIPVIVLGAGDGGARVLRAMLHSSRSPYRPVALLDDDPSKRKLSIMGVKVRGTTADLPAVARAVDAQAAVLAMPSATPELLQHLHRIAARAGLQTLVLPPVQQLVGTGTTAELRSYSDEDVLRRKLVKLDMSAVHDLIAGRRVLVTGAGGSIGSELSRQLSRLEPAVLVLLDHDDSLLHDVHRSITASATVHQELADIRDPNRLAEVFGRHQPEVVFHAAALKHVPALESAPSEGWKTNVIGTRNVLSAAETAGVRQFVNISTDKAADPVNVLGYTKRMAEQLTAAVAERTGQRYVSVRFGNVIGSRGSVMETFQFQIDQGGPVTVTHPDVTRFFMAVREAVRLTLQAAAIGGPGEVLVLDMGAPVRILDVAQQLVEQSGRKIPIVFTELRPGEKLHEVLTSSDESASRPQHPLIDHVRVPPAWPELGDTYDPTLVSALVRTGSSGYNSTRPVPHQETTT